MINVYIKLIVYILHVSLDALACRKLIKLYSVLECLLELLKVADKICYVQHA